METSHVATTLTTKSVYAETGFIVAWVKSVGTYIVLTTVTV